MRPNRSKPLLGLCTSVACALLLAAPARAQEVPCADGTGQACDFRIDDAVIKRVPAVFRVQARVAQAQLPVGEANFASVVIKLLRGSDVICLEQVANVVVKESVLNLEVGRGMSCDFADELARNANLALQVCLGGPDACLKPIELPTSPYAFRASYAALATEAPRANIAGQATYAHRFTADRDMLVRRALGTGYFDFYSPVQAQVSGFYNAAQFEGFQDTGFMQWTPVRNRSARRVNICAKADGPDQLRFLDRLVLLASGSNLRGDFRVDPLATGAGLVVTAAGVHVTGDSQVTGALALAGTANVAGEGFAVSGDTDVANETRVREGVLVEATGLSVTGPTNVAGNVVAADSLVVARQLDAQAVDIAGHLTSTDVTAGTATIEGTADVNNLLVGQMAPQQRVAVTGTVSATVAEFRDELTVKVEDGGAPLPAALVVNGNAVFHDHVFFSGAPPPAPPGEETRYMYQEFESRPLQFDGPVTLGQGARIYGDLDMNYNMITGYQVPASNEEPLPCGESVSIDGGTTASTEGLAYLDEDTRTLRVCINGQYRRVGVQGECGDGHVNPGEDCDDGNPVAGDGCTACAVEVGFACALGAPSACSPVCGDGVIRGGETCDDGRTVGGDGCGTNCQVEPGWTCSGSPSRCRRTTVCGNGIVEVGEPCDDGNRVGNDGCSTICTVDTPQQGALRIAGGGARGRLEIFNAGAWGTVCDDYFGAPDALVACRQMGLSGGAYYTAGNGSASQAIVLDDLQCSGSESRLVDCGHRPLLSHNCSHVEDVGVQCTR